MTKFRILPYLYHSLAILILLVSISNPVAAHDSTHPDIPPRTVPKPVSVHTNTDCSWRVSPMAEINGGMTPSGDAWSGYSRVVGVYCPDGYVATAVNIDFYLQAMRVTGESRDFVRGLKMANWTHCCKVTLSD